VRNKGFLALLDRSIGLRAAAATRRRMAKEFGILDGFAASAKRLERAIAAQRACDRRKASRAGQGGLISASRARDTFESCRCHPNGLDGGMNLELSQLRFLPAFAPRWALDKWR
jgi:hypothetical protein